MSGKFKEIIVLDSASDDDDCSTPIPRVKNRDEMKKLENADEDCFILEFDPDDADLDLSKLSISDENADSDLLIVSQKGQVACRDFPHPRYACARFPFRTTPRDSHCEFCYCYVCDLPAPCKMWAGSFNHCFAFDNGSWNRIRKLTRQAKKLQEQGFINNSKMSDGDVKKGTVKWFTDWKGFGFITPDDRTDDLFVHRSSIKSDSFCSLRDGEAVEYKVEIGNDGRLRAVDVTGPNGGSVQGSTPGSGGEERGRRCFKCGEKGHMVRHCVEGRRGGYTGRGGGVGCYCCGEEGHFARECTTGLTHLTFVG